MPISNTIMINFILDFISFKLNVLSFGLLNQISCFSSSVPPSEPILIYFSGFLFFLEFFSDYQVVKKNLP